ncbi:MAG: tRNA (adenosine(37)-N6)-dimethylallyltransferase MiaA [Candidatus Eremiobacteraeota bacterium]|nr:tRNA (adenosine(37)-N6)-dimethylallyltransferase MiaA [Candidatus Eremiobacteraeota bacterium]
MTTPVLVLAGSTGSGKTELAMALAREFDAEIVGADSRQIYRGMEIGTAAPTPQQLAAVPHHLVGFLDPHERYSAARYAQDAVAAIAGIHARGKRAIVTGGTGFYIRALTGGVDLAPQLDETLRERLAIESRVHPAEFLHAWLALHDPRRSAELDPGDRYRVLRALEIALAPPEAHLRSEPVASLARGGVPFLVVFLDVALDELDARIARRTSAMLDGGFVEEAERVGAAAVASNAVGYPQALAFLQGFSTRAEMRATLERATRRYARRQRAWFRGENGALWLASEAVGTAVREKLGWSAKPV